MDVKAGYQLTEVGVIPEDWNNMKLNNLITHCFSGATPRRNQPDFYKGDIRWITSGELNYNVIMDTAEKITSEAVEATNLTIVPAGTFLMAITGLEAEGTRGACGIVGAPSTTNQSCMAVFPNSKLLTSYLFHYYVFRGKSLALQYCQGTKQQSYTAKLVKQLPIAIPSTTAEQRAIAEALSDMDALLDGLDRLIAKKRDLKQAAMQQLLTGQTRLPGFSGAWEVKKLGEIANIKTGPFGSALHESDYVQNGTPIITVEHLGEFGVTNLNLPQVSDNDKYRLRAYSLEIGDIVFSRVGSIDRNALIRQTEDGWLFSGRLLRVRSDKKKTHPSFLSYQFHGANFKNLVRNVAVGQTMASLNTQILKGISVFLPSIPEQTAIAEVLTAMDDELAALVQRREKTRHLKQAMMQTLLSGQTRLIPRKEATT